MNIFKICIFDLDSLFCFISLFVYNTFVIRLQKVLVATENQTSNKPSAFQGYQTKQLLKAKHYYILNFDTPNSAGFVLFCVFTKEKERQFFNQFTLSKVIMTQRGYWEWKKVR